MTMKSRPKFKIGLDQYYCPIKMDEKKQKIKKKKKYTKMKETAEKNTRNFYY